MSRFKADVARARRIEAKRQSRRGDSGSLRLADNVWRCVTSHSSKGHILRLKLSDGGRTLECVFCEIPVVTGSAAVMDDLMDQILLCGLNSISVAIPKWMVTRT